MLTADILRSTLEYDASTGIFTRKSRTNNGIKVGDRVGCNNGEGYWRIRINGRKYLAHRLAWLYVNGEWPAKEIDHINGRRGDNRIINLREATHAQNQMNRKVNRQSASGHKGTFFRKDTGKWRAGIRENGRMVYLGSFLTSEAAHAAYIGAAEKAFGKFASHISRTIHG